MDAIRAIAREAAAADPAHDFSHSLRVLANALRIAQTEGGDADVLTAAAYLHDIANLPKNHPDARLSSERSANQAEAILREHGFAEERIAKVKDAILCHSFSRGLAPQTLEGRIFQDADRLDALGAIGIARTFAVGGAVQRPLYHREDPFLESGRAPDDRANTLDHFWIKLFKLGATMQTATGKQLAADRIGRMQRFVAELRDEIAPVQTKGLPPDDR
ncbi:MAG TPA: HD domain-containing protein [Myxococcales bacterium]|nr:HD domain-containing protein [Myxococcales bacterium]